ncbi:hypothetical protein [Nocardiopsis lucentensis]|uniref:hypothetical protein n=1 Tax=Nocardiopsis lucentensis TaxID=53441 RepID=UPI00034C1C51|nr:hypothetical protein [Nocardiopsis lucentensis]
MADLVLVLTAAAFFALCVLYVRGCERLVDSTRNETTPTSTDQVSDDTVAVTRQ